MLPLNPSFLTTWRRVLKNVGDAFDPCPSRWPAQEASPSPHTVFPKGLCPLLCKNHKMYRAGRFEKMIYFLEGDFSAVQSTRAAAPTGEAVQASGQSLL